MLIPPLLVAFVATVSLLTITPGVDTATVLRASTVQGRKAALLAALGIALGCLAWGAAASLGLGAVLRASETAYTIVKLAGAVYLLWLGAKLLLYPRNSIGVDENGRRAKSGGDAFLRGFLTNVLNPKVGVFYITFLPQFVPVGASIAGYSFFLAAIHVVLTLVWFVALIAATAPLGNLLRRPRTVALLDRVTGGVFVAFSVKLATSHAR